MVSRAIKLPRPARQHNVMFRIQDHFCSMVNIIYVTLSGEQMLILFAAVPGARGWRWWWWCWWQICVIIGSRDLQFLWLVSPPRPAQTRIALITNWPRHWSSLCNGHQGESSREPASNDGHCRRGTESSAGVLAHHAHIHNFKTTFNALSFSILYFSSHSHIFTLHLVVGIDCWLALLLAALCGDHKVAPGVNDPPSIYTGDDGDHWHCTGTTGLHCQG